MVVKEMRYLDSEQREQIGFSFIIDSLQVMTPYGVEEKKDIAPYKNKESLEQELNNLEAIINSLKNNKKVFGEIERLFCRIKDIRSTTKRLADLVTLDDVELYEVKYFSMLMEELMMAYEKLSLNISTISLTSLKDVIHILDPENKKISTFHIYDGYAESLKNIRVEKRRLEDQIFKEADSKKQILLKNERLSIVILEEEEELIIRRQLTEKLSSYAQAIEKNISSLGKLDFFIAKAKLSLKYKAVKPNILDDMNINFQDMFNPEIVEVLVKKGKSFTPISIELNSGTTVLTGANMGGKSVALKTIILNLLLGQCGFYVFARKAKLPILDFIYFISDDLQSVSQGLSTFGAEIVKLKQAIEAVKHINGFMALDEFARGTNPKEGFYLVRSMCQFLNSYESVSLVSTHYDGIAEDNMVHYQTIGLKNIDFHRLKYKIDLNTMKSIDIIQEHMDYRLEKANTGQQVPKDALSISILLGLQSEIIDIAREYYKEGEKHD
jgi:dsDNA-specific endonuclease/ATPase MutS2